MLGCVESVAAAVPVVLAFEVDAVYADSAYADSAFADAAFADAAKFAAAVATLGYSDGACSST